MKVFLDQEFTGLHRDTTIISLGAIAETGEEFYAELNDFADSHVQGEPFLQSEVMPKLSWVQDGNNWQHTITRTELRDRLEVWLYNLYAKDGQPIEIWSDVYAYDWMLFCSLWGKATDVPAIIHYIPRDLATYLEVRGYGADVNREEFAGVSQDGLRTHNALYDAKLIKLCYDRLQAELNMGADTDDEIPPPAPEPEDVPETEEPPAEQPPPEDGVELETVVVETTQGDAESPVIELTLPPPPEETDSDERESS